MALRHVGRCLSYFGLMVIAGLFIAGCVIQDPPAIGEIAKARKALDDAKRAGAADRAPDRFAALEQRYLQARGVFYACQDAEAIRIAQSIIADLAAPVAAPPPPVPANRLPVARLTAPAQAQVGEAVPLDASASSDPDGDALSYTWDFGDGTPPTRTTLARNTHSYARIGNYTARVTVEDGRGGTSSTSAPTTIIQRFVLTERGRKVLFDFNKATLKPEARSQLAEVLQASKAQPGVQVLVVGHTDGIGSDAYNLKLSQRRAESVVNYMVQNGVPRQNIKAEWRGKREPVASNDNAAGRAQNRRVEITLSPGAPGS
jgi:outer membrane protein OmpA-like peptidoglycan-associated protein